MAEEDQAYLDELQRQRAEEERQRARQEIGGGVIGSRPSYPSAEALNRPRGEWGTPVNVTAASRSQQQLDNRNVPGASGDNPLQSAPQGDEAFWAANPNGAVKDPQTGMLIGLGNAQAPRPEAQPALDFYKNRGVPQQQQFQARQPQSIHEYRNEKINSQITNLENDQAIGMRRLQSLSPVSPGRGQDSPREIEEKRLKLVQHSLGVLKNERKDQTAMAFKYETANQKLQKETDHQNAGTEIARWVNTLPKDPTARQQAWQQELANRPDWLEAISQNSGVRDYVKEALKSHQTVAEQAAALRAAVPGRDVAITGGEGGKGRFKVTDPTAVPNVARTRYNRLQGELTYHTETAANELKAKPKQPYSGLATLHATQKELAGLEKDYPGLRTAAPEATATPSATPAPFDYSKIPSGTVYTDPNGVRRRKP